LHQKPSKHKLAKFSAVTKKWDENTKFAVVGVFLKNIRKMFDFEVVMIRPCSFAPALTIAQTPKFLLTRSIPNVEDEGTSVCVEEQRMHLNTYSSNVLLLELSLQNKSFPVNIREFYQLKDACPHAWSRWLLFVGTQSFHCAAAAPQRAWRQLQWRCRKNPFVWLEKSMAWGCICILMLLHEWHEKHPWSRAIGMEIPAIFCSPWDGAWRRLSFQRRRHQQAAAWTVGCWGCPQHLPAGIHCIQRHERWCTNTKGTGVKRGKKAAAKETREATISMENGVDDADSSPSAVGFANAWQAQWSQFDRRGGGCVKKRVILCILDIKQTRSPSLDTANTRYPGSFLPGLKAWESKGAHGTRLTIFLRLIEFQSTAAGSPHVSNFFDHNECFWFLSSIKGQAMYGAIPAPEEPMPRVVLAPRGVSKRAIASAALSVVAVGALVLLASHSQHSGRTELMTQKLNYLIPFNKVRRAICLFSSFGWKTCSLWCLSPAFFSDTDCVFSHQFIHTMPQPYPDNIDDDRAWGEGDYNPKHGYNNADGGDLEVSSRKKNSLL
jgi:hypothetical protein